MYENLLQNVHNNQPLVHCITNYVTVNDVANILLACGASPIMADELEEVEEITSICSALNLNIGTLNERTIESMLKAGKKAAQLNHPVVLDPVGVGASCLRTKTALNLIHNIPFAVIKGNISEIKTLAVGSGTTKGVDADEKDAITKETMQDAVTLAMKLSKKTGAVIVVTGKIDIVADMHHAYLIYNGHSFMSRVTGTGCMLSAVLAAYCAANPHEILESAAAAVGSMGLCGEIAYKRLIQEPGLGNASYRTFIIDAMSCLSANEFKEGAKIEKYC